MSRTVSRFAPAGVALVVGLVSMSVGMSGQTGYTPSTKNGDWPHYTADVKGTKYSPLNRINASNFNKLEVAWRFKTDNFGTRPEFKLEGTPLVVKGVLYSTAGTRRSVFAAKADTGEVMWVHPEFEGTRAVAAPRQLSGRGVSYWTDGKGDERVVYVTTGYRLMELNAKTGSPVAGFGENGVVDLKKGMYTGTGQPIDLETGEAGLHSTPAVVKDTIIVGSAFREGMTIKTHDNTKGLVRAYDAKTGKLLWTFRTIPRPGEYGNETWLNDSWATNGNAGVWTQISVDEDLGLVYLPVEDPSSDFYGGHRPGDNLFADSLVCVDLKTGQRKWHFQVVHHPMWDYDLSSAPILADITVGGKAIKAVALPSKEAFLYVFDRVTGTPVWPIEERPVPKGDVPNEWYSPTQPFPTKPPAYARQSVSEDDLIDFTPELRQQALENVKRYKLGPMFNPPVVSKLGGYIAALTIGTTAGGTNWPGSGYDPETHVFYSQASESSIAPLGLTPPPPEFSDMNYIAGTDGQPFQMRLGPGEGTAADAPQRGFVPIGMSVGRGGGRGGTAPAPAPAPAAPAGEAGRGATPPPPGGGGGGLNVQGLPIVKPPYGTLNAINLDRGELVFKVPHGDTPDAVRNSPALRGLTIPKTGQGGSVGVMVTKTLVVVGDPQVTTTDTHPRGAMLRAYDKATGAEVGAVWMPAPQSGSPMTYMVNGKQFMVVAVSGGNYSGEYLAFALPESERVTNAGGGR